MFIFYKNCHILLFMNAQNLIIYKHITLYHILEELSPDLNFNIIFADSHNSLNNKVKS